MLAFRSRFLPEFFDCGGRVRDRTGDSKGDSIDGQKDWFRSGGSKRLAADKIGAHFFNGFSDGTDDGTC